MGKPLTEEYCKNFVESNNYIYYEMKLEKAKNRNYRYIKVSCGEHNPYWVHFHHFKAGNRCPECNRQNLIKWNENTITEYIDAKGYKMVNFIGEIGGNKTRLLLKCNNSHTYETDFNNFYSGKRCPYCYGNIKLTLSYIKTEIEKTGEYLLLSDFYKNNLTELTVKCIKYNHIFITNWASWVTGIRCKFCYYEKIKEDRKMGIQVFKQRVCDLVQDEYKVIDDIYINNSTDIKIKHKKCNTEYYVRPANFLNGRRCPICNQSNGENKVLEILINNNINNITQYTFDDCKYKNCLQFDFYLPNHVVAIEYQGIQHYEPVDFAGKGEEWANELFKQNRIRDQIKKDYCNQNNIKLIEIPYWEFDNIEYILNKELKEEIN